MKYPITNEPQYKVQHYLGSTVGQMLLDPTARWIFSQAGLITSISTTGSSGPATVTNGVLNIPQYSGGGGGGIDTVLAVGQALTVDRTITYSTHTLINSGAHIQYTSLNTTVPIHLYPAYPGGLKERLVINNTVNDVSWDIRYDISAPGGPPSDLICIQGWNADSGFAPALPSWTTRMEYQYQGHLYEYHLEWSGSGGRTYRFLSNTYTDFGSVGAGDHNLVFISGALEIRPLSNSNYLFSAGSGFDGGVDQTNINISVISQAVQVRWRLDNLGNNSEVKLLSGSIPHAFKSFSQYTWDWGGTDNVSMTLPINGSPQVICNSANAAGGASFIAINSSGDNAVIAMIGSSFVGTGIQIVRSAGIVSTGTGGMYFYNTDSAASFRWSFNGTTVASMILKAQTGQLQLNKYGVGTFTGTTAKFLCTDSSGNIIEAASTAMFNLPVVSAPGSPIDGDVWRQDNTNTGVKIRVNGVTKTFTLA